MKMFSTLVAIFSMLILLLSLNANIDLSNFLYYFGGKKIDFNTVSGNFEILFLMSLTVTNIIVVISSFYIVNKSTLINITITLINLSYFILSFFIRQDRVLRGYSVNPETDNTLNAEIGINAGYLYGGTSDIMMMLVIISYFILLFYARKHKRKGVSTL